jgi:hypothetical protein
MTSKTKLLINILRMASKRYSNDTCNDFNFITDGKLSKEEAVEVARQMFKDGYAEDSSMMQLNCIVMDWLANSLEEGVK